VATARQWCSKHISAATNKHAIIEEQLGMVFSVQSVLSLYNEGQQEKLVGSWNGSSWVTSEQWHNVVGQEEFPLLAAAT
jgi:hypothetical protein